MDRETLKNAICDFVPSGVNISNVNIKQEGSTLVVKIDLLAEPRIPDLKFNLSDGYCGFGTPVREPESDGYCRILDSDFFIPRRVDISQACKESLETKRGLWRDAFGFDTKLDSKLVESVEPRAINSGNDLIDTVGEWVTLAQISKNKVKIKVRFHNDMLGWTSRVPILCVGDVFIRDGSKYLEVTKVDREGSTQNFTVKDVSDNYRDLKEFRKPEYNEKYAKVLERAGMSSEVAKEMATPKPKKTWDGKIITPVELKDPGPLPEDIKQIINAGIEEAEKMVQEREAKKAASRPPPPEPEKVSVPGPNTIEAVNAWRENNKGLGFVRRVEADTEICDPKYTEYELRQASQIQNAIKYVPEEHALELWTAYPRAVECWKERFRDKKPVDGYHVEKVRFVKKSAEVVAEYKAACESFDNMFSDRGADKESKRQPVSVLPHKSGVTDAEIMLIGNKAFAQKFIKDPLKSEFAEARDLILKLQQMFIKDHAQKSEKSDQEKTEKPASKISRIFYHVKKIKDEILHG